MEQTQTNQQELSTSKQNTDAASQQNRKSVIIRFEDEEVINNLDKLTFQFHQILTTEGNN